MKHYRPSEEVDFLIIGGARQAASWRKNSPPRGFSVAVLEQGPYLREKDFQHDEIKYTRLAAMTNNLKCQPHTYRKSKTETAGVQDQGMIEYGRQVGGGSVHFTANYWRLWESDFKQKSKWGGVAGTSLRSGTASAAPRTVVRGRDSRKRADRSRSEEPSRGTRLHRDPSAPARLRAKTGGPCVPAHG